MSASKPDGLDWIGSIFQIEGEADTLILIVQAKASGLDPQQLQIESNALKRKFELGLFKNLIVDLGNVHYFGSELIGALIRSARTCTDRRGKVAFCSPSTQMLEVLESMRLNKLWPILPTRAEALASLHVE
jgi:anti-anti-sigma factor